MNRIDVVARDELEVLDHAEIRRIRDGDRECPPVALERQHEALGREIRRDQLEDLGVDLELREVDGRHPVLPGQHLRHLDFLDVPELDEVVVDGAAVLLLLTLGRGKLVTRDLAVPDKSISEAIERQGRCQRWGHGSARRMVQSAR